AQALQADLGSLDFWGKPAEERDRYFGWLRREAPISRHQPPEDILGLPDQGRMSYWAIVRYEDVRRVSRAPQTFCSGQGTQVADAPPEFLRRRCRSWPWTRRGTPSCAASSRRRSRPGRSPASRRESASTRGGSWMKRRPAGAATSSSWSPSASP